MKTTKKHFSFEEVESYNIHGIKAINLEVAYKKLKKYTGLNSNEVELRAIEVLIK